MPTDLTLPMRQFFFDIAAFCNNLNYQEYRVEYWKTINFEYYQMALHVIYFIDEWTTLRFNLLLNSSMITLSGLAYSPMINPTISVVTSGKTIDWVGWADLIIEKIQRNWIVDYLHTYHDLPNPFIRQHDLSTETEVTE